MAVMSKCKNTLHRDFGKERDSNMAFSKITRRYDNLMDKLDEFGNLELTRTSDGQVLSKHQNFWIVVRDYECMKCHEMLWEKEVVLSMGSLCNTCFEITNIVIWYTERGMIEYCVNVFDLVENINVEIVDKLKYMFKVLQPEALEIYSDLSAHKVWRKEDQLFVHTLRARRTEKNIKVIKFDGIFYLVVQNDGSSSERGADSPNPMVSPELQEGSCGQWEGRDTESPNSNCQFLQEMFD